MRYILFSNSTKQPTLHHEDCFHYLHRKTPGKSAHVQWTSSPHQSIADAIQEAVERGKEKLLHLCHDCTTPEDRKELLQMLSKRP